MSRHTESLKVLTIAPCVQLPRPQRTPLVSSTTTPVVRTQWRLCGDPRDSMSYSTTPVVVAQILLHVVSAVAAAGEAAPSLPDPT